MLINYLQPVVKETLKGWLLSPERGGGGGGEGVSPGHRGGGVLLGGGGGGGGVEELSLAYTGGLRPKGVPFSEFKAMDDSQRRFLAQQSVALRWYECLQLRSNIKTLSTTTVSFRTTFTRRIILNLHMKWLQGWNL